MCLFIIDRDVVAKWSRHLAGNRVVFSSKPTCMRYKVAPSWYNLACRSRSDGRIHQKVFFCSRTSMIQVMVNILQQWSWSVVSTCSIQQNVKSIVQDAVIADLPYSCNTMCYLCSRNPQHLRSNYSVFKSIFFNLHCEQDPLALINQEEILQIRIGKKVLKLIIQCPSNFLNYRPRNSLGHPHR